MLLCPVSLFYLLTRLMLPQVHHKLSSHISPVSTIYNLSIACYRIVSSTGLGAGFCCVGWWMGKQESSPKEIHLILNWFKET